MKITYKYILAILIILLVSPLGIAQHNKKKFNKEQALKDAEFYKIVDVPFPKDIVLEVGGLALTDDNKLGIATRRGEIWLVDNPTSTKPKFNLYAQGMHEVLGLAYKDNSFFAAQRGELTQYIDENNDGEADYFKTIYSWPLSGNYHEYSYGPRIDKDGNMYVHMNCTYAGQGYSKAKWRAWLLKISPKGEMTPIATGFRGPVGFTIAPNGDLFYSENQGDWIGSGWVTHIEKGDFVGHPAGLAWTDEPNSPLKLKPEAIQSDKHTMYEYAKEIKELKTPAVWLPHTILGISTSDILYDTTGGNFGPFEGQQLVGDQGNSKIVRVFMEKVNGVYQGAAFGFVEGFSSGILRMIWAKDNSMFVGMTSRGWGATGKAPYGLQRLIWTGKTPFEIKTMKALKDGFELEFTKPINKKMAKDITNYNMATFTYKYHVKYGSPIVDKQNAQIKKATVSKNGLKVKLTVNGMRLGYIHQISIPTLTSTSGDTLLHTDGYYTLNQVPGGILKSPKAEIQKEGASKKSQSKRTNKKPIEWNGKAPQQKITIGTLTGLKFSTDKVVIKSGERIQMTLSNSDEMLHNIVIMKPGAETPNTVGTMALQLGLDGPEMNYVPDSDLVLYHSGIVEPESKETIYFTAPNTPGEYWIVCTFPGHSFTMRTKLIVK